MFFYGSKNIVALTNSISLKIYAKDLKSFLIKVESSPGKTRRSKTEEDMVAGVELLAQAIDSVIMRVQVN